jgi:phosphate-selective porin OprO/OprP
MYRLPIVAVLLLIACPLLAQSVEERLARLEAEVVRLSAENQELRKQLGLAVQAAPKAEVVVKPSGRETQVQIGGIVQAQAESGDRLDTRFSDDNDRIFLRRLRLSTNGRFAEHFDFRVESEFAGSLGNSTGMRAQLTDAYVTWNRHPFAQVRVGQFKTPYGHEQLMSDPRLTTPERSLGSDRITMGRQLGIQLAGDLAQRKINYAIGAFNGNGTNASFNDDEGFLVAGRVSRTLWSRETAASKGSWTAGLNAFTSDDRAVSVAPELGFAANTFAGSRAGWGVDSQVVAGRAEFAAEMLRATFDPTSGRERDLESWSVLGGWMFHPRVQGVVRVDAFDAPLADTRTLTLGTNYFIKGNDLKLQFYYLRSDDGEGRVIARLQTVF